MAGLALDTSVVVPALLRWHEHHSRALPLIRTALSASTSVILPIPVLAEAFAVLTRLPHPWRVAPSDAHRLLSETFRDRARLVSIRGTDGWEMLDAALAAGISGGATHDAHIAACACKAGADRLATFNHRDFARLNLGDVELLVP